MDTVSKEKAAILWNELIEYEKNNEMTDDEQTALKEWVLAGNSVHDNGSMAFTEGGVPCYFLDDYRYQEEIRRDLEKLSPREQGNYLARLRGEDTIDNLREDLDELYFKVRIYEQILRSYDLFEKAEKKIEIVKEESTKQEMQFKEWRLAHPDAELPFD